MANKLILLAVILCACLGCGIIDRARQAASDSGTNSNSATLPVNSNKSLTDTAVDAAVGEKKIGIPECDEALELLTAQAEDPEDSFVTKAVKKTALNTFRDHVKKSLEESKTDRKELVKFCREFRDNLTDSKNAENSNTRK